MKHPKLIRITRCTATGENRYDDLVGHMVRTIDAKRDHYIIDEFHMKGSWAIYIEVRKSDCELIRKSDESQPNRNKTGKYLETKNQRLNPNNHEKHRS